MNIHSANEPAPAGPLPLALDSDTALTTALAEIAALKALLKLQQETASSVAYLIENSWGQTHSRISF
jgi:hypothetical protein